MTNPTSKASGKTALKVLRESYGITVTQLCKELNMKNGVYTALEEGHRTYHPERYKGFYQDIEQALKRIAARG